MAMKDSEKPKELIQSYLITSARYDFNVYEKRILYRVVELIQAELKGQPIGKGIMVEPQLYGDKTVTMPISNFLRDGEDKHHARIKKAFARLNSVMREVDTPEVWAIYRVIEKPELNKNSEFIRFEINKYLYRDLLNFAKGYSKYELQVAFNFRSQYTMRFYELISRCGHPSIVYSIRRLREMFMLENRYKETKDFIKNVVDSAQKELKESKAPYYFTYEKLKEGRAFRHVKFNVHYRPDYDKTLQKKPSLRWDIGRDFLRMINDSLGSTDENWKAHRDLLIKVQECDYDEIKKVLRRAQTNKANPMGYAVNAFKKMVKEREERGAMAKYESLFKGIGRGF